MCTGNYSKRMLLARGWNRICACTAALQGVDTQAHVMTLAGKHRRPVGGDIWLESAGRAGADWQTGQESVGAAQYSQYSNYSRVLLRSHYSSHR
jgi:hypothetical protein